MIYNCLQIDVIRAEKVLGSDVQTKKCALRTITGLVVFLDDPELVIE
jgi:hypothetical protein